MQSIIFTLIIVEILCRYILSNNRSVSRLNFLLISGMIQSLMMYPITKFEFLELKKAGIDYIGAPFETRIGILFPTFIALFILFNRVKRKRWYWKDIKVPFGAILIALTYSFVTPFNHSSTASIIVFLLFFQIFIVIYACKEQVDKDVILLSLYDGLSILITIEFIISFSYVIMHIDYFQQFFLGNQTKELEWIREGTNVRRAYGTTYQPNRLAGLCAYATMFFLPCYLFRFKKISSLLLTFMSFATIVFSQSRSALVATVVSIVLVVLMYYYKRHKFSLAKIVTLAVITSLLGLSLLNLDIISDMLFKSNLEEMEEARMFHYILAYGILNDTSFMGVGLNSHVFYMYDQLLHYGFASFYYTRPIHSVHLSILAETGIIGFLFWIYFLISRFSRISTLPLSRMNSPILCFAFVGMLIVVLFHGMTDCLYLHYQYLLILMLVGAFYGIKPSCT